ncbi:MAG: hypothetical protein RBT11_08295 [Desulfobacterales bacterium]|jgi:hypothetical protein|nr:hypothetical protein [Desulfobacterales bacterium]
MRSIETSYKSLAHFVEKEKYSGWDLFDGLNSTLFKNSPLYRSALLRLIWIQFFKRSPVNFRRLVKVPKEYNAKGLGLFAAGLIQADKTNEAAIILDWLKNIACTGYDGISWGYNFDWQARAFYVPAGKPNIVTTVFVAHAFLDYFDRTADNSVLEVAIGACNFILKHLILFEDEGTLCFGYIPGESARVHNANMLGAALLGRVFAYTGQLKYDEKSRKAMAYSVAALRPDHSWPYGELHHHGFVDNFHTGFNLVALKEWMGFTGRWIWERELKRAYEYYLNTFFLENGCPKYFSNSLYPIDIHCAAQGIITCLKLYQYSERSLNMAERIAEWAILNMQDKAGFFYYQKSRLMTNKIPYIRWAQAWMYYALSYYLNR